MLWAWKFKSHTLNWTWKCGNQWKWYRMGVISFLAWVPAGIYALAGATAQSIDIAWRERGLAAIIFTALTFFILSFIFFRCVLFGPSYRSSQQCLHRLLVKILWRWLVKWWTESLNLFRLSKGRGRCAGGMTVKLKYTLLGEMAVLLKESDEKSRHFIVRITAASCHFIRWHLKLWN